MYKRLGKFFTVALSAMLILLSASFSKVQAAEVYRLSGKDRMSTANDVALKIFKDSKPDSIVLVNGYRYPDAATGAPLSKLVKGPVLLTNGLKLEPEILKTIKELGAKKVYILGSAGVVSNSIENELKNRGFSVTRYAGKDRYETNIKVAEQILKLNPKCKNCLMVSAGDDNRYPDSLTVAPIAAMKGWPVIFVNKYEVPKIAKNLINKNKLKPLAVGSSGILPDSVIKSVNGERITKDKDAKNRFDTNLTVLKYFQEKGDNLDFSKVYIAQGGRTKDQFADGLVAAAAAAKTGSPLVLSGNGAGAIEVENAKKFIVNSVDPHSKIYLIGGPTCVSEIIKNDIQNEIADNNKFEVISIN
ncbi:cell wall-binding repeat-containing protein [Clostridium niameyense]|nr:cell wall-binding repeat-containing protein [Clostridium niameyense]